MAGSCDLLQVVKLADVPMNSLVSLENQTSAALQKNRICEHSILVNYTLQQQLPSQ